MVFSIDSIKVGTAQHYIGSHAERWRLLMLKVEQGDNPVVANASFRFA